MRVEGGRSEKEKMIRCVRRQTKVEKEREIERLKERERDGQEEWGMRKEEIGGQRERKRETDGKEREQKERERGEGGLTGLCRTLARVR